MLDIIAFAEKDDMLGKQLFEFERKRLLKYDNLREYATYDEYVKPPKRNQLLYCIWFSFNQYLNGDFNIERYKKEGFYNVM